MKKQDTDVLPDNWLSVTLFASIRTQWRVGAKGATGIDYGCLRDVMELREIPRLDWSDLFDDIRIMERAVLMHFNEEPPEDE